LYGILFGFYFHVGVKPDLSEEELKQLEEKTFLDLILHACRAEPVHQFRCFQGKKTGRLVAVGPVDIVRYREKMGELNPQRLKCPVKKKQLSKVMNFAINPSF